MPTIEKRETQSGAISYRAYVRLKGHPKESATFKRLSDAKKWAQKTEAEIRDGRYFPANQARKHTLAQMIERYEQDVLPNKKPGSRRAQQYQLDWWREQLGDYTLDKVTPALIVEYRDKLARGTEPIGKKRLIANKKPKGKKKKRKAKKRSPATVARFLAALSHVFTVAMKEWQWVERNPLRRVSKPKEPRGVVRFLDDKERAALLEACRLSESKDLYCAVVIALSTGCRKGELMSLRWPQVDLKRGLLTFEDTKNDERRSVPLVGHARKLMKQRAKLRRLDSDLVFPGRRPGKSIDLTNPWKTALERSEVKSFRWHDLRHSCASYLAMNGATLAEIAEVLGHKTLQMVKRYAHLSEAHTSKVVASMNEKIFSEGG
jgi:integrase